MNSVDLKPFELNLWEDDAELIIHLLSQQKDSKSQKLAADLNERFVWNYRRSAIK